MLASHPPERRATACGQAPASLDGNGGKPPTRWRFVFPDRQSLRPSERGRAAPNHARARLRPSPAVSACFSTLSACSANRRHRLSRRSRADRRQPWYSAGPRPYGAGDRGRARRHARLPKGSLLTQSRDAPPASARVSTSRAVGPARARNPASRSAAATGGNRARAGIQVQLVVSPSLRCPSRCCSLAPVLPAHLATAARGERARPPASLSALAASGFSFGFVANA